jgi:hypothetical protein
MMSERRAIKQEEIDVIRTTIARARVQMVASEAMAFLPNLIIVDRCKCGCASVDFEELFPDQPSHPVAHGIGKTPRGDRVGGWYGDAAMPLQDWRFTTSEQEMMILFFRFRARLNLGKGIFSLRDRERELNPV